MVTKLDTLSQSKLRSIIFFFLTQLRRCSLKLRLLMTQQKNFGWYSLSLLPFNWLVIIPSFFTIRYSDWAVALVNRLIYLEKRRYLKGNYNLEKLRDLRAQHTYANDIQITYKSYANLSLIYPSLLLWCGP